MAEGEEETPPNLNAKAKVQVKAPLDLVWTLLLDSVEQPTLYDKNVQMSRTLEREAGPGFAIARKDTNLVAPKIALRHKVVVDPPRKRAAPTGGILPTTMRYRMMVEDATAIFQKIDVNENGNIEKEEILRVLEEDELVRDFCTQIPTLRPLLDKQEWEEVFRAADTNEDGVVSLEEFLAFFAPPDPIHSGTIEFPVEMIGPSGPRGAIDNEMEACKGSIVHEVRVCPDDEYLTEYIITISISTPQDPPPDLQPWIKKLASNMKKTAEKLAYLAPTLSCNNPIYSQKLLHALLKKAQKFKFMSPILARSPSALGCYTRSPTPGMRDGFSPYPPRPGSSLF